MRKTVISLVISITIFISAFAPVSAISVYADYGKYLRVITQDTPFYENPTDENPIFNLPYTYYVKALERTGDYIHVECYGQGGTAGLDGYVPESALFDDGLTVVNPFVVLEITTASTAVLYQDSQLTQPLQYLFADRELKYYGAISNGEQNVYYVSYNNRLGYVKESDVFPFSIPNHPNELTFLIPETPPITEEPSPPEEYDFFSLRIVIIACLVFAGIMALVLVVDKKSHKAVATSYYDDNDYE